MSPVVSARSQISVPPRFRRRCTGRPVSRSIVWATSSPRITCSVKFFEPTTMRRARASRCGACDQRDSERGSHCGERRPARCGSPPRGELALDPQQRAVHGKREQRGGNRAGENHGAVDHRQAAVDVLAESAGADGGGDRRRSDADDGGDANAGHDRRQRERQLDDAQELAAASCPSPRRPRERWHRCP